MTDEDRDSSLSFIAQLRITMLRMGNLLRATYTYCTANNSPQLRYHKQTLKRCMKDTQGKLAEAKQEGNQCANDIGKIKNELHSESLGVFSI